MSVIKIENLHKQFGKLKVLKGITTVFNNSEIVCLIGPNGCGKTTLIKSILGLNTYEQGNIFYDDENIKEKFSYRNQIGYMPQIGQYPENMKIFQLFDMMKDLRKDCRVYDDELYHQFNLDEIKQKMLGTLSGGTKQKVSAALAFLFSPKVVILDEPTAGLDPLSAEIFKQHIKAFKEKNNLVIITSHIISEIEEYADRILYILEGEIKFDNTIAELRTNINEQKLSVALSKTLLKLAND